MRVLTYDLEIQRGPDEVHSGWDGIRRGDGGVSCVALHDSAIDRILLYNEHDLAACMDHLNDADILVSYNGLDFDMPILQNVTDRDLLPHQYDILHEIWGVLPSKTKGYKLN